MKYLFDIGANNGDLCLNTLKQNQDNNFVYMFEPTPHLCSIIRSKYQDLKNWILIEKGSIEASCVAKLYKESVTKDECVEWFKSNGFKVDFFIGDENYFS